MTLPLEGLLVVSLEQAVAAPIVPAAWPMPARASSRSSGPRAISRAATTRWCTASARYFVWLNRGKESVVLDLTKAEDKALLEALLAQGRRVRAEPQARRDRQARFRDRAPAPAIIRA